MRYVLGVDIGSTRVTAAICRRVGQSWSEPEVVFAAGSALHVAEDGTIRLGVESAGSPAEAQGMARGYLRRVGDEVPYLLGGEMYTPETLAAAAAGWVVDHVSETTRAEPVRMAFTHPPGWGQYRRRLLHDALHEAGMPGAVLLPTPIAAAEFQAVRERIEPQTMLAVCQLGGHHVETAVVRRNPGAFELVTHGEPAEPYAGFAIDEALAAHIGGELERTFLVRAKEMLSMAPETTVPTPRGPVRITRAELERLIRPILSASLTQLRSYDSVSAVLLAGGTARIPLVSELVRETMGGGNRRVLLDADPATVVARGAALVARPPEEALSDSTALVPRVENLPEAEPEEDYDAEPAPPRPPVELTPLEPPKRRFVLRGGRE